MIAFRHADPRYPFLWQSGTQPAGRWHAMGEGPAHYFSDTPDGAWAEFLRHEEITEPEDLTGIRRALWAIDLGVEPPERPALPLAVSTGAPDTYGSCQSEARRLRAQGAAAMTAPSAALLPGAASGCPTCVTSDDDYDSDNDYGNVVGTIASALPQRFVARRV